LYQEAVQQLRYVLSYDIYIENVPGLNIVTSGGCFWVHYWWKILQQSW